MKHHMIDDYRDIGGFLEVTSCGFTQSIKIMQNATAT